MALVFIMCAFLGGCTGTTFDGRVGRCASGRVVGGGLWWQTKSTGEAGSLASDAVSVVGDEEGEVSVKDHVDGDPEGDARAGAAGVVRNPE